MFNKVLTFLGFNTSESCVGLSKLIDEKVTVPVKTVEPPKKELKLSDLMRGNY